MEDGSVRSEGLLMWKYLKQFKIHNLGIGLLVGAISLTYVGTVWVAADVMDSAIAGDWKKLIWSLSVNLLLLLSERVLAYLNQMLQAHTIALMDQQMQRTISERLRGKTITQFDRKDSGEYISWYINDIREAENRGFRMFYQSISNGFTLFASMAALFFIKAEFLIVTVVVVAINLILSKYFENKVSESASGLPKAMEAFTNAAKQNIASFPMLKTFRRMERFDTEMKSASEKLEEARYHFAKEEIKGNLGADIFQSIMFACISYGTYLLCGFGWFSLGMVVSATNYIYSVQNAFSAVISLRMAMAGAKPYFAKIDGEEEFVDQMEGELVSLPKLEREIEIKNVSFSYTDVPVLRGINMKFQRGGKYVLVGKSGSGKSTLLKLLLGDRKDYQGEILFDGKDAKQFSEESIYAQIAYIEQNVFLFHRTIRENITLGDSFTEAELEEALKKSALLMDMHHFENGLETDVGENGENLSGGQKQRIAIARALIHKRSILFVDEGTSALDKENAAAIEDALLACEDLTLVMISHHLREEKKKCYTGIYQI